MKKNIKLLLLAALAWPGIAAAQEVPAVVQGVLANEVSEQNVQAQRQFLRKQVKKSVPASLQTPRKKADSSAPAIFVQNDYDVKKFVCNGSQTNAYLPVYSYYFEKQNTASQWIYPYTYFSGTDGIFSDVPEGAPIKINALTFYASTNPIPSYVSEAEVYVRIGEVSKTTTTISSYNAMTTNRADMGNPVFEGHLSVEGTMMTVTFNQPYIYGGNNLIIDIQMKKKASSYASCNWYGVKTSSNTGLCVYGNSNSSTPVQFLPAMRVSYSYTQWESAETIDFGAVVVGQTKSMPARINNPCEETMVANLSTSEPFGVSPSTLTIAPGMTDFNLSFTPPAATNYNGKLSLGIDGQTALIDMRGAGFIPGTPGVRDEAFFDGITYNWPINTETNASKLTEIATDPDQIIAMLREVYTNKDIPGNLTRGYTKDGAIDNTSYCSPDVQYTAAGTLVANGNYIDFEDTYGWNIPCDEIYDNYYEYDSNNYMQWFYMNPQQYRPTTEGVTLLLLEMVDNFKPSEVSITQTGYDGLREYIRQTIKSARVVTGSKRTGEGLYAGTLFKIDCDKMNKFYLIAKGQLQNHRTMLRKTGYQPLDKYYEPCYLYGQKYLSGTTTTYEEYYDPAIQTYFMLGHMFEQFSPAISNSEETKDDIYRELVETMESFGVNHDCPNVPYVQNGHHFMMYGEESDAADCQDVRDMMFFVPDYRMMAHDDRGFYGITYTNGTKVLTQDFFTYNPAHQPTMGLFVIHQDEIPVGSKISSNESTTTDPAQLKGLYKHQLKWYSNLDDFLPSDEQYYELWELVVDEFGKESYVPVYYRNANGEYRVEQNGQVSWVSDTAGWSQYLVPIVLSRNSAATVTETVNDKQVKKLLYTDIYVDMKAGSQTKTYVVRGRDSENFLSLQMSNQEEIVIPGLDPNEKVRLIGATYYSRYNPDNEKNCYSNKLEMKNNATGLTSSDVTGKTIKFYRSSRAAQVDGEGNVVTDAQGNIQYVTESNKFLFATGAINGSNLDITLNDPAQANEFPVGASDAQGGNVTNYAGYHANGSLSFPYIEKTDGTLDFGNLVFWDNFTVDVSKNKHPLQYLYRMEVGDANSDVADSYSNNVRVPVYKTASRINPPLTKEQVEGDTGHNPDYSPGDVEFGAQVQLSSKTEILRYDAYRWDENTTKRFIVDEVYNNDTEQDLPPDGMAGNQGDFYTVSMNDVNDPRYYYAATGSDQPAVTTGQPLNWATFVDYYPKKVADEASEGMAYVYAPVVELFTKGYNATNASLARKDYNTYGGPMQKSAVGKVDGAIVKFSEDGYETSTMTWKGENDKIYCYYNLPVSIDVLGLPANYEVYKVRAWRQIDTKLLGECPSSEGPNVPDRSDRISGDYLFEELNFGDDMYNDPGAQTVRNVSAASLLHYELGNRFSTREDAQHNERMATFGAVKLGDGESMDVKIIVRVYFTKGNGEENGNSQHGPRRVLTPENLSADGKYYVAEKVVTTKIQGSVVTDLDNLKASREVESVNYVNTMGQVSNRPWQGVNVVITRYTDGTTMTTKAVF